MVAWLSVLDDRGFVVAGWDGKSPGTKGTIKEAGRYDIPVWRLAYHPRLNGG